MPCRLIDGDSVARSKKLHDKVSESFRIHYPYWLTLAQANGTFECDAEQIHRDLYAYLMPNLIKVKQVRLMIRQFVEAEVLVTWEENGKTWGFFVGNEKPGRLPAKSQLNRFKNLPPVYPKLSKRNLSECKDNLSEHNDSPSECLPRIGLDWIGKDRIGEEQESKSELSCGQSEKEQKMKLKNFTKRCIPIWQKYFGEGAVLRLSVYAKDDIEFLTESYDVEKILLAFDLFAKECFDNNYDKSYAVSRFATHIADYMKRVIPLNVSTVSEEQNKAAADARADQVEKMYSSPDVKPTLKDDDFSDLFDK